MATELFRTYGVVQDAPGLTAREIATLAEFKHPQIASRNLSRLKALGHVRAQQIDVGKNFIGKPPLLWFPTDKVFNPGVERKRRKSRKQEVSHKAVQDNQVVNTTTGRLKIEHFVRITVDDKEIVLSKEQYDLLASLNK